MNVKDLVFELIAVESETEFHKILGELQETIGVDDNESLGNFFDVPIFIAAGSKSRRQMILSYISNEINFLTR